MQFGAAIFFLNNSPHRAKISSMILCSCLIFVIWEECQGSHLIQIIHRVSLKKLFFSMKFNGSNQGREGRKVLQTNPMNNLNEVWPPGPPLFTKIKREPKIILGILALSYLPVCVSKYHGSGGLSDTARWKWKNLFENCTILSNVHVLCDIRQRSPYSKAPNIWVAHGRLCGPKTVILGSF